MSSIHVNYLLLCYCPSNRDTSLDQRQTDRQTTRRCWSIYHPNLAAIQFISISDFSLSFILLLRLSTLSRLTQSRQWQFNVSFVSGSVSSSAIHRVIKYILIHLLIFRYGEVIRWWLVLSLIRCEFSGRRRWSCHG